MTRQQEKEKKRVQNTIVSKTTNYLRCIIKNIALSHVN